ncbi:MAG: hypothetical protein SPL78_02285 [Bacteroidales bacterium]|nr:hypothetical protein [Bacteroidales bacterium]
MKKFLLLAAVVAAAFAGNAQDLQLTKAWQVAAPAVANCRQGVSLDGKYLINNKVEGIVYQYSEENMSTFGETGATASWPAIAKDEAGNIIVRVENSWPGNFMADTTIFKIFPAGGGEPIAVEGNIFADFEAENGRADYLGSAEGNLLEEGALYIVTAKSTGVLKVPFVEGEIDADHIALIPVEGADNFANSGTVVDVWTAADGTKHYMLFWRGIVPYDMTLNEDGDLFTATTINTYNRANLTGYKCFSRNGKNYIAYSLKPADRNYGDGFAIMEIGGEEPVFQVEDTGKDLNNGGICVQWFDIDGDYLFQYAGAQYIACYELPGGEVGRTYAVCGAPAALFGMENDWDPIAAPEMLYNPETGLYEWTSEPTNLNAGDVQFKVVQDHAWDVSYPANNYYIPVPADGEYTLFVTYNPETNEVNAQLEGAPLVIEGGLYVTGTLNGWSQDPELCIPFEEIVEGTFEAKVDFNRKDAEDGQGNQFKIIYPYDGGIMWFGGIDEAGIGYYLITDDLLSTPTALIDGANFKMENDGVYIIRVTSAPTPSISPKSITAPFQVEFIYYAPTAIESISTEKADNTWYNMQGVKFNGKPAVPGIYINGGKKVIVR